MVGLGQMGMPMLERLRASGHDVSFRARRDEIIAAATRAGAAPAADFADREVVIICVYSDEQVREVGPEILTTMKPGATLVNHTTCSPTTLGLLAQQAAPHSVRVVDAAVSGGPADVRAGKLTLLIGGDETVLEAVRPVLAAYGDPI